MNWFKKFWRAEKKAAPKIELPRNELPMETMSNFTPRAQQVLSLARREADRFNHNFLGTEHLLLGLIKLGQGTAVNVLGKMGLDLETVRKEVEKQVASGPDQKMIGNIPYTPRVKKVLALACKEAKALNHTYVGTEHILLGLLREGDGVAGKVFQNLGVNLEETRREILRELDPNFSIQPDGETKPSTSKVTTPVPSRFEMPQNPDPDKLKQDLIDASMRYDVYCTERNQEVVVYRNARFKGIKKLYQGRQYDFMSDFIEMEQADGKMIFLSRNSVIKFCEHGITPNAETISTKKHLG
jgi:Clp amino terminal domain, pathogenicity island component